MQTELPVPPPCSSRSENREKAFAHLAAGNKAAAEECFQRAVNVTSCMVKQFVEVWDHRIRGSAWTPPDDIFIFPRWHRQALKERGVEFLVAPYEADAQMAYLALHGDVHAVITEDSDLLVYGCPRVGSLYTAYHYISISPLSGGANSQRLFSDSVQAGQEWSGGGDTAGGPPAQPGHQLRGLLP